MKVYVVNAFINEKLEVIRLLWFRHRNGKRERMQQIAAQHNLGMAFIIPDGNEYKIRWFTLR
jgi:predicted PhzF superfamily epimerase YddE/YHI9